MKEITNLYAHYIYTVNCPFKHVDIGGGDYYVEQKENTLYICFEGSSGAEDWLNNFNFWAKPYKDMKYKWYVHRGFLKIWKGIEDHIKPYLMKDAIRHVVISGFSQGAALALLCHEWCSFHRPDLADKGEIEGYGYGQPRVVWGHLPDEVKRRFNGFTYIVTWRDIVTHLPPCLWFFHHVGTKLKVGQGFHYGPIKSHLSYKEFLKKYEEDKVASL